MPIYEYECSRCGVFEVMQGITEEPLKTCPHCKRCKVKKLISESTFHLKGSGWYATDYAKSNGNGGNGKHQHKEESTSATETASDKTETKPESTTATKTDSKPETKPDSKSAATSQSSSG